MPKVPYSDNVVPMRPALPDPQSLMLAAGMMYNEGRLFDPEPMTPPKSPNQRVREGHQEFEPGYVKGWDTGDQTKIMNMRGQQLDARKT